MRSVKDNGFPLYSFHALDGDLLLDYDSATGKMAEYMYLAGRQIARFDRSVVPITTTTTTLLNVSAVSLNQGALLTLTGAVNGGVSPTGTISFRASGSVLATVPLTGNGASFCCRQPTIDQKTGVVPALY